MNNAQSDQSPRLNSGHTTLPGILLDYNRPTDPLRRPLTGTADGWLSNPIDLTDPHPCPQPASVIPAQPSQSMRTDYRPPWQCSDILTRRKTRDYI